MFFSYRPTPAFTKPLTGFDTGDRSGGGLAAGAACCANALPAAINTAITATSKLTRVVIFSSRQNPLEKHTPSTTLQQDRKSTRLNSSHLGISYAVFCLKKKKKMARSQTN